MVGVVGSVHSYIPPPKLIPGSDPPPLKEEMVYIYQRGKGINPYAKQNINFALRSGIGGGHDQKNKSGRRGGEGGGGGGGGGGRGGDWGGGTPGCGLVTRWEPTGVATGGRAVGCMCARVLRWADGRGQVWVRARLRARLDDGVAVASVVNNDRGVLLEGTH